MRDLPQQTPYLRVPEVSLYRRALVDAMQLECGESVVKALNEHPRIQFLYTQDARVLEGYSIREHTEMVVRQYTTFFAAYELPAGMQRGEFLLTLALHDAGKPIPQEKRDQHEATLNLMNAIQEQLPFTKHGLELAKFLIGDDLLGKLIQSTLVTRSSLETRARLTEIARTGQLTKREVDEMANEVTFVPPEHLYRSETFSASLEIVAKAIYKAAAQLGVPPQEMFDLLVTYYQCDTSAYTLCARTFAGKAAYPGLDFLYLRNDLSESATYLTFCNERKRLQFVPYVEALLERVKSSLTLLTSIEVTEAQSHRT